MEPKKTRVRFAPSPTGPLHMGGVRTALYNYLFAKKNGGEFILRIEDTDQKRYVPGAEEYILESLKWCGLIPDESPWHGGEYGPYRQSERSNIYKKYVDQLLQSGHAYYAFDTAEELDAKRNEIPNWKYDCTTRNSMRNALSLPSEEIDSLLRGEYTVRLKVPENSNISFIDAVRGEVTINTESVDDKVIFKSDGLPTYHLANVVDDHLMHITHVIRGEEWLPSTPLHILLYNCFNWETPQFAHLPLILKPDGKGKLSKRDGDRLGFPVFPLKWEDPATKEISSGYKERGYFPEAFLNMLALLGWNPGTEQEIFSLNELVQSFSLEKVNKAGARFDQNKANWFNENYLRAKSSKELAEILKSSLTLPNHISDDKLLHIVRIMKERVSFINEIYEQGYYLFHKPTQYDGKTINKKWKDDSPDIITHFIPILQNIHSFDAAHLESAFKKYIEENEIGFGKAMIALRIILTGVGGGPSLFDIMEILGPQETIYRLENYNFQQ